MRCLADVTSVGSVLGSAYYKICFNPEKAWEKGSFATLDVVKALWNDATFKFPFVQCEQNFRETNFQQILISMKNDGRLHVLTMQNSEGLSVSRKTIWNSFWIVIWIVYLLLIDCLLTKNICNTSHSLRYDSAFFYRDHYYFPGKEVIGIMLSWAKYCIVFSTKPPGCFGFPVCLMEFTTMRYWTASNCRPIYLLVLCLL